MIEDKFDLNDIPIVGIYEHIASCDMGDVYMPSCEMCSYYKDGCKKPKEVKCSFCEQITALYTHVTKERGLADE